MGEVGPAGNAQIFEGRPPQGEADVLRVCETLRDVLNAGGAAWGRFSVGDQGRVDDVDGTAWDESGARLDVQVTRVEDQAWAMLGRLRGQGRADLARSSTDLTDGIVRAAERKSRYPVEQRASLVLALDAVRSPGFVLLAVVNAFTVEQTACLEALGFGAVWLVGPTAQLTHRLA